MRYSTKGFTLTSSYSSSGLVKPYEVSREPHQAAPYSQPHIPRLKYSVISPVGGALCTNAIASHFPNGQLLETYASPTNHPCTEPPVGDTRLFSVLMKVRTPSQPRHQRPRQPHLPAPCSQPRKCPPSRIDFAGKQDSVRAPLLHELESGTSKRSRQPTVFYPLRGRERSSFRYSNGLYSFDRLQANKVPPHFVLYNHLDIISNACPGA